MTQQSVDFAQEYVKDSRLKFILVTLLLLVSFSINGILSYKVLDLQQQQSVTTEVLEQTQKALQESNDKSSEKVGAALMKGVYGVRNARTIAALEIKYAKKYNIPVSYGLAISAQESKWNAKAVSYNGTSFGIKQIHCKVWCGHFGVTKKDLFDVEKNIELGYKILAQYRDQYGDMDRALMAYYGSTRQWENEEYLADVKRKALLFEMV